jgi:hypothetical protein
MKFKVTNRLNQSIRFGKIVFLANETKILEIAPTSDKFIIEPIEKAEIIIEQIEKLEQQKLNTKGGKK